MTVLRTICYSLLCAILAVPALAYDGHKEIMHHWEDARYIKEMHIQFPVLIAAIVIMIFFMLYKRRKKTV